MDIENKNDILEYFNKLVVEKGKSAKFEKLKVGVDLGTANIVIAVVDENNYPVAGVTQFASVIKDGLVVDYIKAVDILSSLKAELEEIIGVKLDRAAAAVPPGTVGGNMRIVPNVLEAAGFEVTKIVDEPTAAAMMLGISNGAVVDVGGGTTGIANMKDGKVVSVFDEPTGGTHMTLTVAGNFDVSIEEAEMIKRDKTNEKKIFHLVSPVIEKMATIAKNNLDSSFIDKIYLVGGACDFKGATDIFEAVTYIKTIKPKCPLLVTPLGIAMCSDAVELTD